MVIYSLRKVRKTGRVSYLPFFYACPKKMESKIYKYANFYKNIKKNAK